MKEKRTKLPELREERVASTVQDGDGDGDGKGRQRRINKMKAKAKLFADRKTR